MALTNGTNIGQLVNGDIGEAHYLALMKLLRALDALIMPHAKSGTTIAQPGAPADGDVYLIPTSATGADWAGQDGKLARFSSLAGIGWEFYTPKKGWQLRVEDVNGADGAPLLYIYSGNVWLTPGA